MEALAEAAASENPVSAPAECTIDLTQPTTETVEETDTTENKTTVEESDASKSPAVPVLNAIRLSTDKPRVSRSSSHSVTVTPGRSQRSRSSSLDLPKPKQRKS